VFPMQAHPSFRPLFRSDFHLLQSWLCAPHVAPWWRQPFDLAQVEAHFGPRVDGAEPTHVFVIELSGRPIGWIQWYRWADYPEHARQLSAEPGSAGIDLAIGEPDLTGLGLGPAILRAFLTRVVFSHADICAVAADPEVANLRSLGAFRKAGFTEVRTVRLDGELFERRVVHLLR